MIPWVCLQFVIVAFPDHTHYLSLISEFICSSVRSDLFTICFTPFDTFEKLHDVFENIMENGAFALLEQMLHFL